MAKKQEPVSSSRESYEQLRALQEQQAEKAAAEQVPNRRYVGTKETLGFIIWDAAQSFNINIFSTRFITSIVGVDLGLQTLVNSVNSVWDIINDIFFGAVVDKTRTRWGKFRPYL
ncbi:MAG: MFS transporter, partial [Clostridia bacterium]|nr:MFS transporter [Clostridia bacterium]